MAQNEAASEKTTPRKNLRQSNVPSYSLDEGLQIPNAIIENYAGEPTSPLKVAAALNMQPGSSSFRMLCGAANAYGLTEGSAYASEIKVLPLAREILMPENISSEMKARRKAILKPTVINEFLNKYNGSPVPREDIARGELMDMGVPENKTAYAYTLILDSLQSLGLVQEIKNKQYVDLTNEPDGFVETRLPTDATEVEHTSAEVIANSIDSSNSERKSQGVIEGHFDQSNSLRSRRVFVTHGKNKAFVEPIKKLLSFGELEAVVSVEKQSVSQPVPDKVMSDMRQCGAAIIHVDAERKLIDQDANEQVVLNSNVLIEIGGALALYGRRFVLLVKEGVTLPSNLQGLYEVRYSGETLDGDATIKLLEAIRDIKNHPLPSYAIEDKE